MLCAYLHEIWVRRTDEFCKKKWQIKSTPKVSITRNRRQFHQNQISQDDSLNEMINYYSKSHRHR